MGGEYVVAFLAYSSTTPYTLAIPLPRLDVLSNRLLTGIGDSVERIRELIGGVVDMDAWHQALVSWRLGILYPQMMIGRSKCVAQFQRGEDQGVQGHGSKHSSVRRSTFGSFPV